jgi:photosystem II stability/assembly factor-like uncharacterized protein
MDRSDIGGRHRRAVGWLALLGMCLVLLGCGQPVVAGDYNTAGQGSAASAPATPMGSTAPTAPTVPADLARVQAAHLITPTIGWALTDQQLRWTTDAGSTWTTITPPNVRADRLLGVSFLDTVHGWAVATGAPNATQQAGLVMLRSADGGKTWQESTLAAPSGSYAVIPSGQAAIDFLDAQHGWVVVTLASSSNFSRGELFQTVDGGATWKKGAIPIGSPVHFVTATDGWTAGGAGGNHLYVTHDGGQSWTTPSLALPETFAGGQPTYAVPTFVDQQTGVLPVTLAANDTRASAILFYVTQDGGHSWATALTLTDAGRYGVGVRAQAQVVNASTWLAVPPGGQRLVVTRDGGRSIQARTPANVPDSVAGVTFASEASGWIWGTRSQCAAPPPLGSTPPAKAVCRTTPVELSGTTDGGQSWVPLAP